jgi:hypothetical protein
MHNLVFIAFGRVIHPCLARRLCILEQTTRQMPRYDIVTHAARPANVDASKPKPQSFRRVSSQNVQSLYLEYGGFALDAIEDAGVVDRNVLLCDSLDDLL